MQVTSVNIKNKNGFSAISDFFCPKGNMAFPTAERPANSKGKRMLYFIKEKRKKVGAMDIG
jgi:hypothetical protein